MVRKEDLMKKTLFIFLFLLSIVCFTNIQTSAASTVAKGKCGKNATWILTDNKVLIIKGKGAVGISYKSPIYESDNVKKIVICDGITEIKANGFRYMEKVEEIELPDSLKKIGTYGFSFLSSLKSVRIPKRIKNISEGAFEKCRALKEIILPLKLKRIGEYAFYDCRSLEKITIPKTVTAIKWGAFDKCRALKAIILPQNIKLLENNFVDCLGLTTIVNRSNKSLRLDDCKGKKKWKVNGKKAKILPGKKTAKTKKITFKITYDLRGGETMGELPSSYCYGEKVDLPDVVKPGYQFLGWKIFSFGVFSQYYHLTSFPKYCNQDIDFVAMFVKLDLLNLSDGELKVSVDDDKLQTKLEKYDDQDDMEIGYIAQISENEDMSKAETLWLSKNKTTELYENSFKNLKLGKRYYVRISYYYVDEYGEEDLKLLCPKWYLKQAVDIVR